MPLESVTATVFLIGFSTLCSAILIFADFVRVVKSEHGKQDFPRFQFENQVKIG